MRRMNVVLAPYYYGRRRFLVMSTPVKISKAIITVLELGYPVLISIDFEKMPGTYLISPFLCKNGDFKSCSCFGPVLSFTCTLVHIKVSYNPGNLLCTILELHKIV